MAAELGGLSGKLGGAVVLREGHGDEHVAAGMRADELRLEAGDEHAAAERETLLFCRAAVKLLAVDKAGVVQNHVVSHFGSALGDGNHARRLLAEPVHLAVQLMLRDRQLFKICLQTLVHKAHDVSSQKLFLMLEIRISPATTRSSAEKPVSKLSEYSTWLLGGNSSSPA